jgi:alginate O-acetyltransferase complex protein AlgI
VVFSSPIFVFLFLPVVLGLHYVVPMKWRNSLLLLASLVFYAWGETKFIFVLLLSILFNHVCGRIIYASGKTTRAKLILAMAVSVNLAVLATFKYGGFLISDVVNPILSLLGSRPLAPWLVPLPIGISFFTFHALSYLIDIYRSAAQAQRSLGTTALYITLFPQLIAGPIIRYKDIAAQFIQRSVSLDDFYIGVRRFAIGLGKKMLIANSVAITADQIFGLPANQLTTPIAWLGVTCYTLQIYFDFSGYSDMAIGLARMFGFRFLENFNYPYISESIQEFWRRWHISLSNWFRDYLYIPLGGSRVSNRRTYANLVIVFFLCGLWHGASWTFVFWGMWHGLFLVLERLGLGSLVARQPKPVRHIYTMLVVMVGWVFFRAETFAHAGSILAAMFGFAAQTAGQISVLGYLSPGLMVALLIGMISSAPFFLRWTGGQEAVSAAEPARPASKRRLLGAVLENAAIVAVLVLSLVQVAADTYNPFIYFRF